MSRQFVTFATQLAVITGAIVGMLYLLGVGPYYMKLTMAIGIGVLALSTLVMALSNMPFWRRGSQSPDNNAKAVRAAQRARTRALLRRFSAFLRDLRRAQPWFRLWYREPHAAPWWLVLGPEGHGKSTLLLAARDAREHAPPDPSTREPRFFSAPGLAFLELPEDAADHPGLRTLLRRIARKRPDQPFAGILVVARLDTLDESPDFLTRTRAQILQISGELAIRPPVVLAFTHLDRLTGYAEFCDGLPTPLGPAGPIALAGPLERPLGVTLSACDSPGAVTRVLQARLAEPLAWVRQRCHALVARPRVHDQQPNLYSFWQHLEQLADRTIACAGFLAALPLPGGESLRPRGLYFVAASTSVDPPSDTWLDRLAARIGGAIPAPSSASPRPPQAFVRGLFATELLRDSQLAARLRPFRWRRASIHAITATAAASMAVYVTVATTEAARANHEHMQATWDAARDALRAPSRKAAPAQPLDTLRRAALHWRAPELGADWGLARGDLLADASAAVFTRSVCASVLRPIALRSQDALERFAAQFASESVPNARLHKDTLDHLHAYTLLSEPSRAYDPWSGEELAWLSEHLDRAWAEDDETGETTRAAILATHAELVPAGSGAIDPADPCTSTRGALALVHDPELVVTVSRILQRVPIPKYTLDKILATVDKDRSLPRIDLTGTHLRVGSPVAASFTHAGWRRVGAEIRREVDSRHNSLWFMRNNQAARSRQEHCLELRDLYVDRYLHTWSDAIDKVRIKRSADLLELEDVLNGLRANTPLHKVFASVGAHTQYLPTIACPTPGSPDEFTTRVRDLFGTPGGATSGPSAAVGRRDAPDVAAYFARFVEYGHPPAAPPAGPAAGPAADGGGELPLATYHAHITLLSTQLKAAQKNAERTSALLTTARDARVQIVAQIDRGQYGRWNDALQDILLPPLDDLVLHLDGTIVGETNKTWCSTVVGPLRVLLRSYPFDREARSQAALADITRLFHPETGEIAKFRLAALSGFVDVAGVGVTPRPPSVDADLHINPAIVSFLDDAHKLGLLLHPGGTASLDLSVGMACQAQISKLILTIDGTPTDYICSINELKSVHWPGTKAPHETTLVAHGNNGGRDVLPSSGEFGLLRLLEQRGNPVRLPGRHDFGAVFHFGKFGALKLAFKPQTVQSGSLIYGFGDDTRFLAPFRTPVVLHPPESLFSEHPRSCAPEATP